MSKEKAARPGPAYSRFARATVTLMVVAAGAALARVFFPDLFPEMTGLDPEIKSIGLLLGAGVTAAAGTAMSSVKSDQFKMVGNPQDFSQDRTVQRAVKTTANALDIVYNKACFPEFYKIVTVLLILRAGFFLFETFSG